MIQSVILGCGYTGRRVAERLLARGDRLLLTTRHPGGLADLGARGATVLQVDTEKPDTLDSLRAQLLPGCRVLYSIPPVSPAAWPLLDGKAARVVYLSSTGIYGAQSNVDENTPPAPESPRELARTKEEQMAKDGHWSWLILRPAAIYGPGRGVHIAIQAGTHRLLGNGENFISRIHVDDLAAHAEIGLHTDLSGEWPVADEEPCPAIQIAEFCAGLLGVPLTIPGVVPARGEPARRSNRRVDGRAIRTALRLSLRYPTYRVGIPAALSLEKSAATDTPMGRRAAGRDRTTDPA